MRKIGWLTTGVVAGFVLAHIVNSTSSGRRLFASIDQAQSEFFRAFANGYQSRDLERSGRQASAEHDLEDIEHYA